jgi:hypothetical protein
MLQFNLVDITVRQAEAEHEKLRASLYERERWSPSVGYPHLVDEE